MPSLIDTHSHIYVDRFNADRDAVMARAREAGVEMIIVPATRPTEFADALALAEGYPEVRVAIGVHPHHAAEITDSDLEEVERLAGRQAVAIGEIGLDYHYDFAPRDIQHRVFREQLRIAKRLDLPAVIHNRESDDDLLNIIQEEQEGSLRFQLHCFSSGPEILQRALELGAMISFTGNITYPKSTLDDVVRAVPDDRIMIETDAPYLTPVPFRGKRNEPAYVTYVAEKIAGLRGKSLDEITQMTTENARRFFKLAFLLLFLLPFCPGSAEAQPPQPIREIDTTVKPMYDKWFGIGGHIASGTYISGAVTEANAKFGTGFWLSITPLQSLNIDWLQLDVIYTHVLNEDVNDSAYVETFGPPTPPNTHNQLDISLRAIANARNIISLFLSLGITHFHNEFGADRPFTEPGPWVQLNAWEENAWGWGGSIGVSVNINTPYALIAPTAEWRVAKILGDRELDKRKQEFFVSQPRIGLLIYPHLSKLF
jgi:TatD DNase family protein